MKKNLDKQDSDEKVEKKNFTTSTKFLEKLDFIQINEPDKEANKEDSKDKSPENDPHAFPLPENFLDKLKDIKSGKSKLIMGIIIFAGVLLIIIGVFLVMGSPERVADNAQFGDMASFSVFLILIGIILIAGALASKFLDKSFFKGINSKIEAPDETSGNSTKKNIKGDNINRNNE